MRNIIGEITGLINEKTNEIVIKYNYNPYEKVEVEGSLKDVYYKLNRILYKGYYYDKDKLFNSTTFLASAKGTLLEKESSFGLAVGYFLTAVQYYNLIKSIFTTPDFENSRWILY